MFTLDQFAAEHAKVKSGADFPRYVQALKALGMDYYDFFVSDGHSVYHSTSGQVVSAPAKYAPLNVAAKGDAAALAHTIKIHQQGQTNFATFCQQAADAGVSYWRTDVSNLQCIYVDSTGTHLLVEPIPDAAGY